MAFGVDLATKRLLKIHTSQPECMHLGLIREHNYTCQHMKHKTIRHKTGQLYRQRLGLFADVQPRPPPPRPLLPDLPETPPQTPNSHVKFIPRT